MTNAVDIVKMQANIIEDLRVKMRALEEQIIKLSDALDEEIQRRQEAEIKLFRKTHSIL